MKNMTLSVIRNFNSNTNPNAPEYSDNFINVKISIPNGLTKVHDITIRIYSSKFKNMGTGYKNLNPNKTIKNVCIEIANDEPWESGDNYIFVSTNGIVKWLCKLESPFSPYFWDSTELEDINNFPIEKFFIEKLSTTNWWNILQTENPDEFFINNFIKKLNRLCNDDDITDLKEDTSIKTTDNINPVYYDCPQEDFVTEGNKLLYEEIISEKKHTENSNHEDSLIRLNNMIGLCRVKEDIHEARIMSIFNKKRIDMNLQTNYENRNHMLFLGNPGTGKTTVAKLIGEMYNEIGLLSKGQIIETNRSKLIGEYIGVTEKNTLKAIEEAKGGVLFIDEAYTLINNKSNSNDFGKEVINALLPILSEPNPDIIIIMAGYEDKMYEMLKVNPGLKDRFPLTFYFEDYSASELMEIAMNKFKEGNYKLTEKAYNRLYKLIEETVSHKDRFFGNGRWIHNLINHGIIKSMAKRVMSIMKSESNNIELLCNIEENDIIEAEKNFVKTKSMKNMQPRPIGFRA